MWPFVLFRTSLKHVPAENSKEFLLTVQAVCGLVKPYYTAFLHIITVVLIYT